MLGIQKIAKEVIENNPKAVEDYKKGTENALQFLLGQMMAATKGTINPELASAVIMEILDKS